MKIKAMQIEGFRSYKQPVLFHFEPTVTVIMGANDHGKSNLLAAIDSLNASSEFSREDDLSWDLANKADQYPLIRFDLELDDAERRMLSTKENDFRKTSRLIDVEGRSVVVQQRPIGNPPKLVPVYVVEETNTQIDSGKVRKIETFKEGEIEAKWEDVPTTFSVTFKGCQKDRIVSGLEEWTDSAVESLLDDWLPRIEIIEPWTEVSDSATWSEFENSHNEFMRGIFYYAGLDPTNCEELFTQDDSTVMELANASAVLNSTLRTSWTQGSNLEFMLRHNSKSASIELLIKDPAVEKRFVRASKRSSGFTHYFTLKTILYARQRENEANYRVILFDEPGIYLHPAGQMDLLRVLRQIGSENQVLYVTHSLFMIDKNYPSAHRLLVKTRGGTAIDGKPYAGGWGRAMSALGITLAGSILFASHVLLTEGDSDPVYLYAILGKLNEHGIIDLDLNSLAIIATGEGKNADALIRMLVESANPPKIAYLSDGDAGGAARVKELATICEVHGVKVDRLPKNTAIEDHLIGAKKLLLQAAATYAAKLRKDRDREEVKVEDFQVKLEEAVSAAGDLTKISGGVISIIAAEAGKLAGFSSPASKVGIAREYATLLETSTVKLDGRDSDRALKIADKIQQLLSVPKRSAVEIGVEEHSADA